MKSYWAVSKSNCFHRHLVFAEVEQNRFSKRPIVFHFNHWLLRWRFSCATNFTWTLSECDHSLRRFPELNATSARVYVFSGHDMLPFMLTDHTVISVYQLCLHACRPVTRGCRGGSLPGKMCCSINSEKGFAQPSCIWFTWKLRCKFKQTCVQ